VVVRFCQIAGALALVPQLQYSLAIIVPVTIIAVMITVVTAVVPVPVMVPTVIMFNPAAMYLPVALKEPLPIVVPRHPASSLVGRLSPITVMPLVIPSHGIPIALDPNELRSWWRRLNVDHAGRRWSAN